MHYSIDKAAIIGEQPKGGNHQSANEWQGSYDKYAAYHEDINGITYQQSRFYYDGSKKYLANPLHSSQTDWFFPNPTIFTALPVGGCAPTIIIPIVNTTDIFIEGIIEHGLYPPTTRGNTQQWIAERQLYDVLKTASYSEGQYDEIDQFLAENSNSTAKQFFDLDEQIKTIKDIPNVLQAEIDMYNTALLQQYKLLSAHDSTFHYNTINQRPVSPSFWDIRANINALITEKQAVLAQIDAHIAEDRAANASVLKELNNQIVCNEIYEANERDVNNVIFDILINQQATFDENQENPLIHIALQCPEDGGWAVFEARAILAQKYDYQYNFDDICGSKPIGTKVQKNHVFNTLTVAPNPIKEEFTVFIAKDDDSHYDKIEIVDMYGRSVYSAVIGEKEKTIRINSAAFANGSYQCVLFGGSTILARQKLFKINQ